MTSKVLLTPALLSVTTLVGALASLPLYAADLNVPLINTLVQPIGHVDAGTWFLICAGIGSLIITRKFVR